MIHLRTFDKTTKITLLLALLFVVGHTVLLGVMFPHTLRQIEMNCWIDDYLYQFFRWPWLGAFIMAAMMVVPMLLIATLLHMVHQPRLMPLSLAASLALAYFYPPTASYDWGLYSLFSDEALMTEQIYRYEQMANQKQWTELKNAIRNDGRVGSNTGLHYMLLCESALGTLADNIFTYPINETELLLYRGKTNQRACTFNRIFYENLGVYDEAYHQAQEYSMCLPQFCLQSLCQMIDYSILESEWEVADKLLTVLDQALFYHKFVADRRAKVAQGRIKQPVNPAPIRANNFVTGYPLQSEFFHDYMQGIGDSNKTQEYTVLCLLIRKNLPAFYKAVHSFPRYDRPIDQLPLSLQQAIQIYESKGQALHDAPAGTYAYYFYNATIPEVEEHPESPTVN